MPALISIKTKLMKQIVAIVKPFLAERVLEALATLPIEALSLHEVRGYGRQKSYLDATTEQDQSLAFLPKVEVECWVEDNLVELVIERLMTAARTGRMGDGKVFVLPVPVINE
jgi:nitrogen regulatory protein PII